MITYVDTSTLLKLLIQEDGSEQAALIWDSADVLVSATLVMVEARAALAAAERSGRLTLVEHRRATRSLELLFDSLTQVEVSKDLVEMAADLAEQESLRGYDAVHLAASLLVEARIFTSADVELCEAASRCGMYVANPIDG